MLVWTVAIIVNIVGGVMNPVDVKQLQQLQQQQQPIR
jgi:hypothetical protein